SAVSVFFVCSRDPRSLLSFPTRRSSDLLVLEARDQLRHHRLRRGVGDEVQIRSGLMGLRGAARAAEDDGEDQGEEQEAAHRGARSEEHTSELQSPCNLVCRLLLEKNNPT